MFDSVPDGARQFSGRDIDEIYSDYFRRIREIAATGLVDCLAHLDLVKIHGYRPSTPIAELVDETLELIRSRNLAIELSTAGWRKPVKELYPSDGILTVAIKKLSRLRLRQMRIPGRNWAKIMSGWRKR